MSARNEERQTSVNSAERVPVRFHGRGILPKTPRPFASFNPPLPLSLQHAVLWEPLSKLSIVTERSQVFGSGRSSLVICYSWTHL